MTSKGSEHSETLDERLEREARFHDEKYAGGDLYPRHYAVQPTEYIYQQMKGMLGDIAGKRVLEYGCGEGWITCDLAHMGAQVSAFDVSPQAVENTRRILTRIGRMAQCDVQVMPAEKLTYPDATFDVAVGFAIIHHLELRTALAELHRVLKPGGVAYFAEPLGTNPLIQLYRRMTPQFRTADERPLVLSELPELLSSYTSFGHQEFYVSALAAVAVAYLPGGARLFTWLSRVLHRCDRALLRAFPALGSWAWYSVIKVVK